VTFETSVEKIAESFEHLWPCDFADDWDAPGFAVRHPSNVTKVLLTVDVTATVMAEAKHRGANLIVSHHPFLLKSDINWDAAKGQVIKHAVRDGISLFSAHTNADVVAAGVSDTIAKAIGLRDCEALLATGEGRGHGRVGVLPDPMTLEAFAQLLVGVLPFTARGVAVSGYPETTVSKVALCGGAGDSFISNAFESGADVYLTSDLRHHPTSDAIARPRLSQPFALVDISHWAAESLWLQVAMNQLGELHPEIEFMVSEVVTDPWSFVINRENDEG
jgi:dinuclear metal center YbgI/SA1388 family protein